MQQLNRKRAATISLAAVLGATPFVVTTWTDAAHAARPARIKGQVTAAGAGPLAGIRVSTLSLVPVNGVDQWVEVDYDHSDVDGLYNVGKLDDGVYRLRFYDPSGVFATEFYDDAPRADEADDVVLLPGGGILTGINAELGGAAHLTGRVTDNLGAALAGAVVTTYVLQGSDWVPYQSVESSADGSYDLGGLPAGEYTLGFSDPASGASEYWNDQQDLAAADTLAVDSSGTTTGLDASLDTGAAEPPPPTPTVTETATATATATATETATATATATATETASSTATATATTTATTTATPAPAPAAVIRVITKPRIKGVAVVGKRLRVTKGVFAPSLVARKVQWLVNGKAVKGATRMRFRITPKMRGKRVSVRMTVSVPGSQPLAVKAKRTTRVRPAG